MNRIFHLICVLLIAFPVWAGEYVVLGNGFRLHADRHEADGSMVRLFDGAGVSEIPAASIATYEPEETIPNGDAPVGRVVVAKPVATAAPDLAASAAQKFNLPESFVRSVMKVESGFNPAAISPKGATGLMQLMPETARRLGVDPKNPQQNAEGGAQYLKELLARYEDRPDQVLLALAAYNAGPGAVERYHGVPPYQETREYILRVLKNWDRSSPASPNK